MRRLDWQGLIQYGAIFFMLEKLGAVVGVSSLHIYAAMRGETLEALQKTRNAPRALYSVAGKGSAAPTWDSAAKRDAEPHCIAIEWVGSPSERVDHWREP